MKNKSINIFARRWFDRRAGNTYHSVEVSVNNTLIGRVPFEYGYGEHYLQTAHTLMQEKGYAKRTNKRLESGMNYDFYNFMRSMRKHKKRYIVNVADVATKSLL